MATEAQRRKAERKTGKASLPGLAILGAILVFAAVGKGEEQKGEARWSLSVGNEAATVTGLRVPLARNGNLLLVQPSFAYRQGQRWRFSSSLAGIVSTQSETHARLRVKETYFSVSAQDLDLTAGKKIVRWGTGYAFTPTGVLDPPRIATDPTDRLNLNEGREMVLADWVRGRHAITAAWASAGLLHKHVPGMRETVAFRYNTLLAGFDTSLVFAKNRDARKLAGLNFTRVLGQAVEVHAEFAHRQAAAVLLGGKYTPLPGLSAIVEYYTTPDAASCGGPLPGGDSAGLPEGRSLATRCRRQYLFLRLGKSRLRELPGWKEWDVSAAVVANLDDGSRVAIFDVSRLLGLRFSAYARAQMPAGKEWRSEYGMLPYSALISAGLRFQI